VFLERETHSFPIFFPPPLPRYPDFFVVPFFHVVFHLSFFSWLFNPPPWGLSAPFVAALRMKSTLSLPLLSYVPRRIHLGQGASSKAFLKPPITIAFPFSFATLVFEEFFLGFPPHRYFPTGSMEFRLQNLLIPSFWEPFFFLG